MREKILQLEKISRQLEPNPALRQEWTDRVTRYAGDFIDGLETGKGWQVSEEKGRELLEYEFSESGRPLEELLGLLERSVDTPGLNPASGGHLGYIPGGGIYPTALADYLAAVTNRYAGIFFANPGAVRLENLLIRWMCRMVGYPDHALGNLASGGSIANLTAIVTAREAKQIRSRDVDSAVIYLTSQVHHCIHKAIRIAGLGEAVVRFVPVDAGYHMEAGALRQMLEQDRSSGLRPFLVVASAGTTDTGVIDPLDAIADLADEFGLWFHVDAAYGGFFMLVDNLRQKFAGIERSDSVVIDPHKGLFLSYGLGAVLIKDVAMQYQAHYYRAPYMQDTLDANEELSPADLSPELTKHFRGLRNWLALQLFGIAPFRACLEEKYWLCRFFYESVQKMGFEVGPEPELSVCIYRYLPRSRDANEFNRQLVDYVQRDGRVFLSSTTLDGVFWIRLAVLSFRTRLCTIEAALAALREGVQHIERTGS
jgi:glutamate/tyrosine decarboxylase-like PLP-dependent enzyme